MSDFIVPEHEHDWPKCINWHKDSAEHRSDGCVKDAECPEEHREEED